MLSQLTGKAPSCCDNTDLGSQTGFLCFTFVDCCDLLKDGNFSSSGLTVSTIPKSDSQLELKSVEEWFAVLHWQTDSVTGLAF